VNIKNLLVAGGISLAGLVQAADRPLRQAQNRPNIVVVMADDMGFSDIGCYGGEIETPVLDTIAQNGIRYRNMSNTAKCHSSRVSLLSGLHSLQAGGISLKNAATFPELLNKAGYATAMVGKWHLSKTPHDFGFEKYFGHLSGASPYIVGNKSFLLNGEKYNKFGKTTDEFYLTDANTDYAIDFFREWKEAGDKRPFLMYMAYNAPHAPLCAPEELVRKYRGRYMEGWHEHRKARLKRQKALGLFDESLELAEWTDNQRRWDELTENEKSWEDYRMAIYAAMVDSLDQNIGRFVKVLKEQGQWDNTLFIFVSDNGANPYERSGALSTLPWLPGANMRTGVEWGAVCNTPFKWYKQNMHRGGVSTPGIIHWPVGIKVKGWNDTPSHLIDIAPTLLELAGVQWPETFKGKQIPDPAGQSLVATLNGETITRTKPIYYNYADNYGWYDGRYKLVSYRSGPWELYDLVNDPTEKSNLASTQAERVAAMSDAWYTYAEKVDKAKEAYRTQRKERSIPWGTSSKDSMSGKKGEPKADEQKPRWGTKPPPLPLP